MKKYKLSGHDSFICRYAWISKAIYAIQNDPLIFSNEDQAIIELGIGKNMVKSLRFWIIAMGVVKTNDNGRGLSLTFLGKKIFSLKDENNAFDPYLEDIKTIWLLHWNLSSNNEQPLLAWDYMLNNWYDSTFDKEGVIRKLSSELMTIGHKTSEKTIDSHVSIFLNTYFPTKGRKGEIKEDNLDSPLVELALINKVGSSLYKFNKDEKPEITEELFIYAIIDYKHKWLKNSEVLTFRQISIDHGSPGQIFKLSEADVRSRLESLKNSSNKYVEYKESANSSLIIFTQKITPDEYLCEVYND